ncbi:glycosyltransferase family 2 protein [Synechococcus sp. PCC 7336]|uniref:glycosyltransferase family 2 protein n=1 Tax=Synechococcus sp. PCC 7336 TaxID=195250 RepID=UPI00034BF804|nr:glycosyltransferase family 2 protein [Synechococcus sp. PCC 7336]
MTIDAIDSSVFILIPVHDRKITTLNCLNRLHQQSYSNFSIVVIDDGSTDGTLNAIRAAYPSVTVLQGDGNLWWTGAVALGMQYARDRGADFFVWLNDDCQVSPGSIDGLVEFCQSHPNAIVGCQGFEAEEPKKLVFGGKVKTWRGFRLIQPEPNQVLPCDLLSGNLVCIPRSVVEIIGYPNPQLTPHYGGDSLFLIRAKKAGFSLFLDTRTSTYNTAGEATLYPSDWLLCAGGPLRLLKLVFTPHSGLSWRVWWQLNWEAYSYWGLVMFVKKYSSLLAISLLRFVPLTLRKWGISYLRALNS